MKRELKPLLAQFVAHHVTGVSTAQIWHWASRLAEGYLLTEFNAALNELRDAGQLTCSNKRWWFKYPGLAKTKSSPPPMLNALNTSIQKVK